MAEKKRVSFTIEQKNKFLSGENSVPKKLLLRNENFFQNLVKNNNKKEINLKLLISLLKTHQ